VPFITSVLPFWFAKKTASQYKFTDYVLSSTGQIYSILILIVVRTRVTRARVRVSRAARGEAALRARARAAKPRHVAAKPRII